VPKALLIVVDRSTDAGYLEIGKSYVDAKGPSVASDS
jgi:hypothetical protein